MIIQIQMGDGVQNYDSEDDITGMWGDGNRWLKEIALQLSYGWESVVLTGGKHGGDMVYTKAPDGVKVHRLGPSHDPETGLPR